MERVFAWIGQEIGPDFEVFFAEAPCASRGLFRRLINAFAAARKRHDVVHVTGDINYVTLCRPGRVTVQTLHDIRTWHRLRSFKKWLFAKFWIVWPIAASDVTTVVSEFTKREIAAVPGVNLSKVFVVHNPLDPLYAFREKSWNSVRPRLLVVGTAPNKNLERVFEAVQGIACDLVLIGPLTSDQRAGLKTRAITFEQRQDLDGPALYAEYCASDVVLFASTYEGFGLPIIEAQAVGRPVVTSNVAAMPEVAGEGAVFVDPFDVQSIRRGILAVLGDGALRTRLIATGRVNAERFAARTIAAGYAAIYRQVLSGRS